GPTGTVILTHAELMELLDKAVAKAAAAAGGALSTPAGGASASGVEGQYRRALAVSQAAAAGLRTVTEEQLQQALMGTLAPETIPKPAARSLDAQQAKLVLGEDGRSLQWEAANKRTRCSTLPEWERGFCHVLRKVKSDRQHRLMIYFKDWFQQRATEYGVVPLIKFYEFMILQMEEDPSVTFERRCYSELFEDYSREQHLRPDGQTR
ncbi:hypothetical protein CYMTET_24828, partial [Cymbomonas tetramitiformis]